MECDRFKKLVKSWYLQVQDEALAPARMVSLMKQHLADCRICQTDPGVRQEVDKIIEIILPPSKVRVGVGPKEEEAAPEAEEEVVEEAREKEEEGAEEEDPEETEEGEALEEELEEDEDF